MRPTWNADIDADLIQVLRAGSVHDHRLLDLLGATDPESIKEVRTRYVTNYKNNNEIHTKKIISIEEAARLVASCVDARDKAMIVVMLKTGVRGGNCSKWMSRISTGKTTASCLN